MDFSIQMNRPEEFLLKETKSSLGGRMVTHNKKHMSSESKSTPCLEKILNPEWNQVYAFSKDLIQYSLLVITVMDKNDDFMGRVEFEVKSQLSLSKPMDENPKFLSLNPWLKPVVAFSLSPWAN